MLPSFVDVLCESPAPARVTSHMNGESAVNGDAHAVGRQAMVARGTDAALAQSAASKESKSVVLLANIQSLLGCTLEEVRNVYWLLGVEVAWCSLRARRGCLCSCFHCRSTCHVEVYKMTDPFWRNLHARPRAKRPAYLLGPAALARILGGGFPYFFSSVEGRSGW